ncbi:muts domain V [Plectosphaerella plurivora]|uniref:DNA mismatch repair protein MSH3 n=1 Tax=Plectosphaerella plurivora TaxID=936078 RepID=A0A9P8V4V8_9PEZI|nr:muts domain V [Plectosphaerella plurivora]
MKTGFAAWPTTIIRRPTTAQTTRRSRATPFPGNEGRQIVCALSEARGVSPSVGVAFVNISTGEVILSKISDSQFYVKTIHKLDILEPAQILLISSVCPPNPKSNLYDLIEEHLTDARIIPFDRKHWSEADGLDCIRKLASHEDAEAVKVAIQGNYYTTCALAAVIKYLESEVSLKIVPHSLRIRYEPSEDTMMIDTSAIRSLELIQNLRSSKSKDSLYGLLNHTQTPMGARLLRNNLIQPSTRKDSYLEPRYEAVSELIDSEDMLVNVRKALKAFNDVEGMLSKLVILPREPSLEASEYALNQVISVKSFLSAVPDLLQALSPVRSGLLEKIRDLCRPQMMSQVSDLIAVHIEDDITFMRTPLEMRNSRMFAVKSGVNGLLDVSRKTYSECTKDVMRYVEELGVTHDIETKVKYDPRRQYWIQLRAADFEDRNIPTIFVNLHKKKGFIECLTLHLKKLNHRIHDSVVEAIQLGDAIIQELLDSIRTQVQHMFRVCESVALLDMLSAFAHVSILREYTKPDMTGTLGLKAARHPVMDKTIEERIVPNDFYASEEHRFHIITGCNMSGKSTYLRTVALLQVMAQIGCFVPAEYAAFSIIHSLFARVTTDDSIEANMSTFSLEMREMAFILRNVNEKSMVIIDELGRGTSTRDGLSIAIAMAEALIQSHACVWFATHFTDLAEVLHDRPGVLNLHLATRTAIRGDLPEMTMLYTVMSGSVSEEHYGLTLAKAVGLPGHFLDKAEEVSRSLRQRQDSQKQSSEGRKLLKHAAAAEMQGPSLAEYLVQLQEEFITRMAAIEDGVSVADVASSVGPDDVPRGNDTEVTGEEEFDDEGLDDESLWGSSVVN